MRIRIIVAALSFLGCAPAMAKEEDKWDPSAEIGISPQFGKNLPKGSDNDTLDDSSLGADLVLTNKRAFGWLPVELRAGTTFEPETDSHDPTSSVFGKITLGDTYIPFKRLIGPDDKDADDVTDAFRPYLSVTGKALYDGYLAAFSRRDLILTAGFRLRDVLTIKDERKAADRDRPMQPAYQDHDAYSNVPGVYYEFRGEVGRTWSNNPLKERITPRARLDLYSRLIGPGFRIFGRAEGSIDYYDLPSEGSVGKRTEKLVTGTLGFDFTDLAGLSKFVDDLSIGFQYQRNWSNALNQDYERFYVAPSLTLAF